MNYPQELKYTKTDEWVKVEDGMAIVGISDFAQHSLSDVVYLEFSVEVDDAAKAGDNLGTVESVKAASDINIPVSGKIIAVNIELSDTPETLNQDPYEAGWLVKIQMENPGELEGLLNAAAYEAYCQER